MFPMAKVLLQSRKKLDNEKYTFDVVDFRHGGWGWYVFKSGYLYNAKNTHLDLKEQSAGVIVILIRVQVSQIIAFYISPTAIILIKKSLVMKQDFYAELFIFCFCCIGCCVLALHFS